MLPPAWRPASIKTDVSVLAGSNTRLRLKIGFQGSSVCLFPIDFDAITVRIQAIEGDIARIFFNVVNPYPLGVHATTFYGGGSGQLLMQLIDVSVFITWAFVVMYVSMKFSNLIIPIRPTAEEELKGLDGTQVGVLAYPDFEPAGKVPELAS